ncbi:helicase HerA-like domain-containing protein [Microtetraspora malaysiensis]|uniref:helicase HerA-like domain-containing protein n=1 Tax=Microtetraspora malaysiensis TaxID=161358 RepID=UPI003D89E53D
MTELFTGEQTRAGARLEVVIEGPPSWPAQGAPFAEAVELLAELETFIRVLLEADAVALLMPPVITRDRRARAKGPDVAQLQFRQDDHDGRHGAAQIGGQVNRIISAGKSFEAITQTVRLIRSKGVGVFFVTQTPKDVPADVLGQLGSRVQHALRAFTPQDAKDLRATVSTFPASSYNLEELLTQLGIGEAVVTVLSETGAPTPVAWTRLRAPESLMAPSDPAVVRQVIASSSLLPKYGTAVDRESAYEMLNARLAPPAPAPTAPAETPERWRERREEPRERRDEARERPGERTPLEGVLRSPALRSLARSAASALGREITRSIFGTARRRR